MQFRRLDAPLLSASAASRLESIEVEIDNLYSAYDAKAELDAVLPEIEAALERKNDAVPLPIPVCTIVGDVLGSYIAYHKPLDRLFYEAGVHSRCDCSAFEITRFRTARLPLRECCGFSSLQTHIVQGFQTVPILRNWRQKLESSPRPLRGYLCNADITPIEIAYELARITSGLLTTRPQPHVTPPTSRLLASNLRN